METQKLSLADFKLSVQQDSKRLEDLMGGLVLAGCHSTCTGGTGCPDNDFGTPGDPAY